MTSGATTDANSAAAAVLAAARVARVEADAAEVRVIEQALAWAALHEATCIEAAATWRGTPVPLAGAGAPLTEEFCVAEFAAVLGLPTEHGRTLLAHALELAHRLPRLWARVTAGAVPVWRARRVAEQTLGLSREAAAFVDAQVAGFAHRIGPAALERLVDEAIARHMPAEAEQRALEAADTRHVTVDHRASAITGTSLLTGELDLADALELDAALTEGATALKELGSTAPLDARRATALGYLARGQQLLDLTKPADLAEVRTPTTPTGRGREVVLYLHLTPEALTGTPGALAHLENHGGSLGHLITATQVATWCAIPEAKVTLKPVIDLADPLHTTGYQIPERLREQIILRDHTCVFPHCTRPARHCDLDHIEPWDQAGPTSTTNLAALCRHHHRLKTHSSWTYQRTGPATYTWTSPTGHRFHTGPTGTEPLPDTPPPRPTH